MSGRILMNIMSEAEGPTKEQIRKALGQCIKILRRDRGIAQEELARKAGVDRAYMGGLERGLHTPSIETVIRIARALNLSLTFFCRELERCLRALPDNNNHHPRKKPKAA